MGKESYDATALARLKECYEFAASYEPSSIVRAIFAEKIRQLSDTVNGSQRTTSPYRDVDRLKQLLSECFFCSGCGGDLYRRGTELLKRLHDFPIQATKLLPEVRRVWKMIEWEVSKCDKLMHSPYPTEEQIHVLYRHDLMRYRELNYMTASSCVYLILMFEGPEAARNFKWDENAGLQGWFRTVNMDFLPALCQTAEPEKSWIIRKRNADNPSVYENDSSEYGNDPGVYENNPGMHENEAFNLTYVTQEKQSETIAMLRQEPFGACSAFNPDACGSETEDVPVCWGVGNILSVQLPDALTLLQGSVVTTLRCPKEEELAEPLPDPFTCAKTLADGLPFCISPEELLLAMNRWQFGHRFVEQKDVQVDP